MAWFFMVCLFLRQGLRLVLNLQSSRLIFQSAGIKSLTPSNNLASSLDLEDLQKSCAKHLVTNIVRIYGTHWGLQVTESKQFHSATHSNHVPENLIPLLASLASSLVHVYISIHKHTHGFKNE